MLQGWDRYSGESFQVSFNKNLDMIGGKGIKVCHKNRQSR